jgi:hypothetical protein
LTEESIHSGETQSIVETLKHAEIAQKIKIRDGARLATISYKADICKQLARNKKKVSLTTFD